MEPMVAFSAVLVAYYSYLALLDVFRDLRSHRKDALLETAVRQTTQARLGAAARIIGIEKLSKTLALRSKRINHTPMTSSAVWLLRQGAL